MQRANAGEGLKGGAGPRFLSFLCTAAVESGLPNPESRSELSHPRGLGVLSTPSESPLRRCAGR